MSEHNPLPPQLSHLAAIRGAGRKEGQAFALMEAALWVEDSRRTMQSDSREYRWATGAGQFLRQLRDERLTTAAEACAIGGRTMVVRRDDGEVIDIRDLEDIRTAVIEAAKVWRRTGDMRKWTEACDTLMREVDALTRAEQGGNDDKHDRHIR